MRSAAFSAAYKGMEVIKYKSLICDTFSKFKRYLTDHKKTEKIKVGQVLISKFRSILSFWRNAAISKKFVQVVAPITEERLMKDVFLNWLNFAQKKLKTRDLWKKIETKSNMNWMRNVTEAMNRHAHLQKTARRLQEANRLSQLMRYSQVWLRSKRASMLGSQNLIGPCMRLWHSLVRLYRKRNALRSRRFSPRDAFQFWVRSWLNRRMFRVRLKALDFSRSVRALGPSFSKWKLVASELNRLSALSELIKEPVNKRLRVKGFEVMIRAFVLRRAIIEVFGRIETFSTEKIKSEGLRSFRGYICADKQFRRTLVNKSFLGWHKIVLIDIAREGFEQLARHHYRFNLMRKVLKGILLRVAKVLQIKQSTLEIHMKKKYEAFGIFKVFHIEKRKLKFGPRLLFLFRHWQAVFVRKALNRDFLV